MHIPNAFHQHDRDVLDTFIERCGLATLVSPSPNGLIASHVPLSFKANEGENGTLYGHLARGNPHWRALGGGTQTLVIFSGPDAYISPSWYATKAEHGKVVPTWNYVAVHAYGEARLTEGAEALLEIVSALTNAHEKDRPDPWQVSDAPPDYIEGMLRAIVGFALPIERLEGKWKLGQNRSTADIAGVHAGLAQSDHAADRALAAFISPERRHV
jgi:transcriptional regulator